MTSGIDWFELHGGVTFDGQEVPLPTLLAALRRGEALVLETLTGIRRAGADIVITYHAKDVAEWLR